ncbi:MAG: ArsI/CadI family heavy metal resistance metalloenzyme [Myxococcota bacterium]
MRFQLALSVEDIDRAIEFSSKLFRFEPAQRKPGYASFAIESPPLELVRFEARGAVERIHHLGVEVFDGESVTAATERLEAAGLETRVERETTCCHAKQDEVWAIEPQGLRGEGYRDLADSASLGEAGPGPSLDARVDGSGGIGEGQPVSACCA